MRAQLTLSTRSRRSRSHPQPARRCAAEGKWVQPTPTAAAAAQRTARATHKCCSRPCPRRRRTAVATSLACDTKRESRGGAGQLRARRSASRTPNRTPRGGARAPAPCSSSQSKRSGEGGRNGSCKKNIGRSRAVRGAWYGVPECVPEFSCAESCVGRVVRGDGVRNLARQLPRRWDRALLSRGGW